MPNIAVCVIIMYSRFWHEFVYRARTLVMQNVTVGRIVAFKMITS